MIDRTVLNPFGGNSEATLQAFALQSAADKAAADARSRKDQQAATDLEEATDQRDRAVAAASRSSDTVRHQAQELARLRALVAHLQGQESSRARNPDRPH